MMKEKPCFDDGKDWSVRNLSGIVFLRALLIWQKHFAIWSADI